MATKAGSDTAVAHNKNTTAVQVSPERRCLYCHLTFRYSEFSFQRTDHLSGQLFSRDTVSVKQFLCLEFREKPDLSLYGLHSFRHLFASLLVNQGVYIMTVSGALGHSTVSTTSNIYCHMLEEAQAKVSDAVSSALDLSGKKKEPKCA